MVSRPRKLRLLFALLTALTLLFVFTPTSFATVFTLIAPHEHTEDDGCNEDCSCDGCSCEDDDCGSICETCTCCPSVAAPAAAPATPALSTSPTILDHSPSVAIRLHEGPPRSFFKPPRSLSI